MVERVSSMGKLNLQLNIINQDITRLEQILIQNNFINDSDFKYWLKDFREIYGKIHTNLRLYIIFAILYFVGHRFILKFVLKDKELPSIQYISSDDFHLIEEKIKSNYPDINIFNISYFNPFYSLSEKIDLTFFHNLLHRISKHVFELKIKPEFIFDYLIQKILSPIIRHKAGEFYTPIFLVKKMVNDSYSFGNYVLDPSCGSGNFLVEIIKLIKAQNKSKKDKVYAINRIYGYDINPISIYVSKINLLYLLKEFLPQIKLNLFVHDSLFQNNYIPLEKFDLIIGNPPWYTYRDIESAYYQSKIKNLAEKLGIKPQPKNILNLEISTLFFYMAKTTYMRNNSKIFFVITKGVITGSHASRFRNFNGFSDVKIWTFDKKIEKIFNIDFICLFGIKLENHVENTNKEILAYHFTIEDDRVEIDHFKDVKLKLDKKYVLLPYEIEKKAGKIYTKKLISKEKSKCLLPLKKSYYKKLFHKGADLNPRNLIFVKIKQKNDFLVTINPDERIFQRAKHPWNKKEFQNEDVEDKYIFNVIKSTELVKFIIYDYYKVFLPLSRDDLSFNYDSLAKHGKFFYDKINDLYLKFKKETTKNNSLIENLNRWSKLINKRQLSKIKVVYNNSGSTLNSAVIQGDFLITGDLCFYDTNNLNEAYYLSAILNSNILNNQIKIMKSSRHIFKLPLDLSIKKFNPHSAYHQKLVELGKRGQEIAIQVINSILNKKTKISKIKTQNILNEELSTILIQIDEILNYELNL